MRPERLYYFLGMCGLTATFVFTVIAVYGSSTGVPDAGLAGGACAVTFLVPSVVFLIYSRSRTVVDDRLRQLADVLEGYRQLGMDELAAKIGTSPEEAELLVAACIGRGFVMGNIDPATRTFTLDTQDTAHGQEK